MMEFSTLELQWAFNWACDKVSSTNPKSLLYEGNQATANRIHDEYCKLINGQPAEFSCSELTDIASIALDVKIKSKSGTPRYELARTIFQKAVDIRKALEKKTC